MGWVIAPTLFFLTHYTMSRLSKQSMASYNDIVEDKPTYILIPRTRRVLRLAGIKPYTLERLTQLWVERDAALPESSGDTLKSMCVEPYFTIKEACLFWLNGYFKIKFLFPIMWRVWAYVREYTEEQMMPIIQEGKKKLQLTAHWTNMAFSVDMRMDWKKMTEKEAEQYRAELLSVANQLSSKSSQNTEESGSE